MAEPVPLRRASERFVCGDIVYLRSGSSPMTVREVFAAARGAPAKVSVDWFCDGEHSDADFFTAQLTSTDPEPDI
jgi:hypothetical protein